MERDNGAVSGGKGCFGVLRGVIVCGCRLDFVCDKGDECGSCWDWK